LIRKAKATQGHRLYRVLLPLSNLEEAKMLLPLAEAFVQQQQGQLVILHVEIVPEGHPLSEATTRASRTRQALSSFLGEYGYATAKLKSVVRVAREIWEGIWETVDEENIDLLIFGRPTEALSQTAVGDQFHQVLERPPCAVVVVHPRGVVAESQDWGSIERILLPMRDSPNAGIALRVALVLADIADGTITLLHMARSPNEESEEKWFATFSPAIHNLKPVTRSVTAKGEVASAILDESISHQTVILGAPSKLAPSQGRRGSIFKQIQEGLKTSSIIVKEAAETPARSRPGLGGQSVFRDRPVAVVVDKWFAENTFHSREFEDLEQLVTLKEEQGLTISLGLPALNEEETVGKVIQTIQRALMEEIPLLDEMVLIDSGSVDYTREIAADLGIPVYIHQDILPELGTWVGKGEALWKSLYVLEGDIIAWIDTDIKNIHPRFVYGVLGPLLHDLRIQYVKGFYRRPLIRGDKLVAGGGGRVTELTARPFINLFYPELSGIIQPLSGEYAGRRESLEQLPFFSGYGVETGLLIDFLENFNLHAIAQVDLLERIHHNQRLHSLSKMSFAIMQVVMNRLSRRHDVRLIEKSNLSMNLIRYGPTRFFIEAVEIQERERPPIQSVPAYRENRGLPSLEVEGVENTPEASRVDIP
jgi:glucosyl-3-phosphoglycerate synthase